MEYVLAPLDGFTDCRYRQAHADTIGGLSRAIAPFVTLVAGRRVRLTHLRDFWPANNRGMAVEPQILGNEEAYFPVMAEALRALGYDCLNWNLGCPIQTPRGGIVAVSGSGGPVFGAGVWLRRTRHFGQNPFGLPRPRGNMAVAGGLEPLSVALCGHPSAYRYSRLWRAARLGFFGNGLAARTGAGLL